MRKVSKKKKESIQLEDPCKDINFTPRYQEKRIQIFVSSTFRDMKAERDELALRIFPALRNICEERGISWSEVDLRWGIPEEKKDETLNICLNCVEDCRPYFIGILGERYGFVNETIPEEIIKNYPWIAQHSGKSVTELEILHGVLNNPKMAKNAFFYFRDPGYVDTLPVEQRINYLEGPNQDEISICGITGAERRADNRRKQLARLKETIRQSGVSVKENYRDPIQFGELVKKDWLRVIDSMVSPHKHLTNREQRIIELLEREDLAHEAFAANRFGVYISRQDYFDRLDAHIAGDDPPLTIIGDSGSGKSALLAHWAFHYRKHHPSELTLIHFIGASSESSDWASMLRRFMEEIKQHFSLRDEIPFSDDALFVTFRNWLSRVALHERVVLVVDALNQLNDKNGAPDLVWLPQEIPKNVRLVLSTQTGRPLDAIRKRGWPLMGIEPLQISERNALITCFLKKYHRELDPHIQSGLAEAEQAQNPLFLRILLEELRLHGEYDKLSNQIRQYLTAKTLDELFEMVLDRYERDYERDRPNLVKDALTNLWSARRGLSKTELTALIGINNRPLPDAHWMPLYLAMKHSLIEKEGKITFFHSFLQTAVEHRYLQTLEQKQAAHVQIANYFSKQPDSRRKIEELPWQLAEAEEWDRLVETLINPQFFIAVWQLQEYDVKRYWAKIETHSSHRLIDAYKGVIENPLAFPLSFLWPLSILLFQTGHIDEVSLIYDYLIEYSRKLERLDILHIALGNKALILSRYRRDLTGAMKLHKEEENLCAILKDKDGLQACLGNQALILRDRGDFVGAMDLLKKQEKICRKIGNTHNLAISLGNQAMTLMLRGNTGDALALWNREENICRKNGDLVGLKRSLSNQAGLYSHQGDHSNEMDTIDKLEQISREIGDRDGLQICFGNRAKIFFDLGDYDNAMKWRKEEEKICRELGTVNSLSISRRGQAEIHYARGDLDNAIAIFKEEEENFRKYENIDGVIECLGGQGLIYRRLGKFDCALALYKKLETMSRRYERADSLQKALGNHALILMDTGHADLALSLLKEQEEICRKIKNVNNLAICLYNQSLIFSDMNHYDDAKMVADEAYNLAFNYGNTMLADKILTHLIEITRKSN